jgi:acyl-CoA thioester hydrolase
MDRPFELLMRVRYGECDAQQVVFNARYADYVDLAITEYFRLVFGGFKALLAQGLDNQVVRLAIDWRSPARFDDVLSVTVVTTRIGNTSYTMRVDFSDRDTTREIATAEVTYVLVSAGDHRKLTLPDDFRARLDRGAPGRVIDQSGPVTGG